MSQRGERLASAVAQLHGSSEVVEALQTDTHLEIHGRYRHGDEDRLCWELRRVLRHGLPSVLPVAREVLAELAEQHARIDEELLKALAGTDARARAAAVRRVSALPGQASRGHDAAREELRRIASRAASALARIARDGRDKERAAALDALRKLGWRARQEREALDRLRGEPAVAKQATAAFAAVFPDEPEGIDGLRSALATGTAADRREAAKRLRAVGPDALPALAEALGADDVELRRAAAAIVSRMPAKEIADGMAPVVPAMLAALEDSDRRTREAASHFLRETRSAIALPATRALTAACEEALRILPRVLDEPGPDGDAAIPELIRLIGGSDTTPEVAASALRILAELSPESAPEALSLVTGGECGIDLETAMRSLPKRAAYFVTPALMELAGHADPNRAIAALRALARLEQRPARLGDVIDSALRRPEPDVRAAAASACTGLGRAGRERAARALHDADLEVSLAGAWAILAIAGTDLAADDTPYLCRLLDHADARVRGATSHLLMQLGPDALEPIADPLKRAMVVALGQDIVEAYEEHVPDLLVALRHPDPAVREHALSRLGMAKSGSGLARTTLLDLLGDHDPAARDGAARALGRLSEAGDVEVTAALTALLDEPDGTVACAAAWGLERQKAGARAAVDRLVQLCRHDELAVRRRAMSDLGELRKASRHAVPALIEGLSDPDMYVHQSALSGFLVHGPVAEEAVPALIEQLGSEDASTRELTALALSAIGPAAKEAATALRRVIREDDVGEVVDAARRALRDVQVTKSASKRPPKGKKP